MSDATTECFDCGKKLKPDEEHPWPECREGMYEKLYALKTSLGASAELVERYRHAVRELLEAMHGGADSDVTHALMALEAIERPRQADDAKDDPYFT